MNRKKVSERESVIRKKTEPSFRGKERRKALSRKDEQATAEWSVAFYDNRPGKPAKIRQKIAVKVLVISIGDD